MQIKLLTMLRCPDCRDEFQVTPFTIDETSIMEGLLYCQNGHVFPIVGGIPRLLPSSFKDHWTAISEKLAEPLAEPLKAYVEKLTRDQNVRSYDTRTKANFSNEWDNHDIGRRTWTMELSDRIKWFFLNPLKIPIEDLNGKVMLDAGCGNGSQSVAYTEYGLEVVALDLSTGLEKGFAYRDRHKGAHPDKVHFIQADLQNPPLAEETFDIIHSAGVLHHTLNTENTFRALSPLLKKYGTFYVWLYKYENVVTPIINSMRAITTRLPAPAFATLAQITALPFIGFCWTVNKLGIRSYQTPDRREATLAVHDIFGAPYAHYHDYDEVSGWFESVGITEHWPCNNDRRGFGICGRRVKTAELAAHSLVK